MRKLILKECGIDYEGMKILTAKFKYLDSLEVLNLDENHLTNESCLVLNEGLKFLSKLEELWLNHNDFDDIGFGYLIVQLSRLKRFHVISIYIYYK